LAREPGILPPALAAVPVDTPWEEEGVAFIKLHQQQLFAGVMGAALIALTAKGHGARLRALVLARQDTI